MPRMSFEMTIDEIKDAVRQLPAEDLLALADAMEERVESLAMMALAESGFSEWNEPGEDIYDGEATQAFRPLTSC